MKFLLGSTLQKVIAAIVAALMSFTVISPAIATKPKNTKPAGIVRQVKQEGDKIVGIEPVIVPTEEDEDEDIVAPAEYAGDEDRTDDPAPAPEADDEAANHEDRENRETPAPAEEPAPAEDEAPAPEEEAAPEETEEEAYEATAEWDISATENDDVHMYFFADGFVGAIRNLFAPMTALAAENDEDAYEGGTIYIDGHGSTDKLVFLNFIRNFKTFARDYENWAIDNGYNEDELFFDKNEMDANGNVPVEAMMSAAEARALSKPEGTVDYAYLINNYYPTYLMDMVLSIPNFWGDYGYINPTEVIIAGEIDSISFGAFAFCPSIERIEITGTVNRIEAGAFAGTAITEVEIPEGTRYIGGSAFCKCEELATVYLPASLEEVGEWAFTDMAVGSTIYVANEDVEMIFIDDVVPVASVDAVEANPIYDAGRTQIKVA